MDWNTTAFDWSSCLQCASGHFCDSQSHSHRNEIIPHIYSSTTKVALTIQGTIPRCTLSQRRYVVAEAGEWLMLILIFAWRRDLFSLTVWLRIHSSISSRSRSWVSWLNGVWHVVCDSIMLRLRYVVLGYYSNEAKDTRPSEDLYCRELANI